MEYLFFSAIARKLTSDKLSETAIVMDTGGLRIEIHRKMGFTDLVKIFLSQDEFCEKTHSYEFRKYLCKRKTGFFLFSTLKLS